jgi:hypothetical protein
MQKHILRRDDRNMSIARSLPRPAPFGPCCAHLQITRDLVDPIGLDQVIAPGPADRLHNPRPCRPPGIEATAARQSPSVVMAIPTLQNTLKRGNPARQMVGEADYLANVRPG